MKKRKKIIYFLISLMALLFPIGYLLGRIEAKVAFPLIFGLLGCQQLFYGFFIVPRENKRMRLFSIIFGSFFLLFSALVVFPMYYL